jgi:hypothetical protein
VAHEAVYKYCEWIATKSMQLDWVALRVKKADVTKSIILTF